MARFTALLFCVPLSVLAAEPPPEIRLITIDPGHFHAALVQMEMLPGVSRKALVYAPLGPDLAAHLDRVARFNRRPQNPTSWEAEVYAAPDFLERMLQDRRGGVAVLSGKNGVKIAYIHAALEAGMHVLADKPWIIRQEDFPKLKKAIRSAERNGLVLYDAMTLRFATVFLLQRALVNDPELFGARVAGSREKPAVRLASVHHLLKRLAGAVTLRPPWFFDTAQAGEGLTDVGTHLVDLAQWILFPDEALDYRRDIRILDSVRWPLMMTTDQLRLVTGEPDYPPYLNASVRNGQLEYFCNNSILYQIRGVHTRLDVTWEYQAEQGSGDTKLAAFIGTQASVELREGKEEGFKAELYVVPARPDLKPVVGAGLNRRVAALQATYPGLSIDEQANRFRLVIPDHLRVGPEAFFLLARKFLAYVRNPGSLPAWEGPNTLAKYYLTTHAVAMAKRRSAD